MRVRSITAHTCRIPLPRPIDLGALHIEAREYAIVIVTTDEGIEGVAYGMTRDMPVATIVRKNLAPLLIDEDPLQTELLWNRMYGATLPSGQRGIVMRAISLVDIALWDIKGKAASLPVYQLLGGNGPRVPAVVVGGYPDPDTSLDDLRAEMQSLSNRGFQMVKMALGSGNATHEAARVATARDALGTGARLMIDVHWHWHGLAQALEVAELWRPYSLTWIEDPFPAEDVRRAAEFRHRIHMPVAIGDEQHGRWAFRELILHDAVDYLRLDATTIGGITEFVKVAALAAAWSIPIATHIYHNLHIQCGAAFPGTFAVEYCDAAGTVDPSARFLINDAIPDQGFLQAPSRPGLGIELNSEAVQQYAVRPA